MFGFTDATDEGWQHMLFGGVIAAVTRSIEIGGNYFDGIKTVLATQALRGCDEIRFGVS